MAIVGEASAWEGVPQAIMEDTDPSDNVLQLADSEVETTMKCIIERIANSIPPESASESPPESAPESQALRCAIENGDPIMTQYINRDPLLGNHGLTKLPKRSKTYSTSMLLSMEPTVQYVLSVAGKQLPPTHTNYAYTNQKAKDKTAHTFLSSFFHDMRDSRGVMASITVGDGNCILHSCSMAIWGTIIFSLALRRAMVHELQVHRDYYKHIFQKTDVGIEEMVSQAGTEKEHLEMIQFFVLANTIRRPILLYNSHEITEREGVGTVSGACGSFWPLRHTIKQLATTYPVTMAWNSKKQNHVVPLLPRMPPSTKASDNNPCWPAPWYSLSNCHHKNLCRAGSDGHMQVPNRCNNNPVLIGKEWAEDTHNLTRLVRVAISTLLDNKQERALNSDCDNARQEIANAHKALQGHLNSVPQNDEQPVSSTYVGITQEKIARQAPKEWIQKMTTMVMENTEIASLGSPENVQLLAAMDMPIGTIVACYEQPEIVQPGDELYKLPKLLEQLPESPNQAILEHQHVLHMYILGQPCGIVDRKWTQQDSTRPTWTLLFSNKSSSTNTRCVTNTKPGVWWVTTENIPKGCVLKCGSYSQWIDQIQTGMTIL